MHEAPGRRRAAVPAQEGYTDRRAALFAAAWRGIRPLLDEATHAKVEFMDDEAAGDRAFQTIVGGGSPFAEADEGPQPGPLSIGNIEEAVLAASPWSFCVILTS